MNIDSSKRKVSRHESIECSQQSIVSAMDRFVMSVNNMEDVVMVPSRLLDLTANDDVAKKVPQAITTSTDLHSFYSILNNVKTELIWGLGDGRRPAPIQDGVGGRHLCVPTSRSRSASPNPRRKISAESSVEYELQSSDESDSGVEFLENFDVEEDPSAKLASNFRRHLSGLFHTLQQLSEVSDYLTTRYQQEVDSTDS